MPLPLKKVGPTLYTKVYTEVAGICHLDVVNGFHLTERVFVINHLRVAFDYKRQHQRHDYHLHRQ